MDHYAVRLLETCGQRSAYEHVRRDVYDMNRKEDDERISVHEAGILRRVCVYDG